MIDELPKPYYDRDGIVVYHGDCRDVLPHLGRFDLLLTDIPYDKVSRKSGGLRSLDKGKADVATFSLEWLVNATWDIAKSHYVWCGTEQISELRARYVENGLTTRLCIWEKTNPSPMNGEHFWLSSLETCIFARHSNAPFNAFCQSPLFRGSIARNQIHDTQKPLWLFRKLIDVSCPAGGTVLDLCGGSLTTAVACKLAGIQCTIIEQDAEYCRKGVERLRQGVLDFEGE